MDEHKVINTVFTTKLSLPKFMSVISRLTLNQKKLVCSMGLGHLLKMSCDVLPRGMICYIVSLFDHKARTLKFPNGPPVAVTPLMIYHVLGTPIGGLKIGESVDDGLRQSIAKLIKCKGRFPTIIELDVFITTKLEGNEFKIAFGMFAMTAFLCPSSHGAVSPEYLHMFSNPDSFDSYDISTAVLDKLANCIELYNKGLSCVLGGNLLSLLIIYLDFRNVDSVPVHLRTKLPRISVWTSEMVTEVESMDRISWESRIYGKLPMKSISDSPFAPSTVQQFVRSNTSYDDLLKFVLSITPNQYQQMVIDKLPKMMANMEKEIIQSIEPILCDNIINVLNLATYVNPKSKKSDAKSAVSGFHTISQAAGLKLPMSELGKEYQLLTSGAQRSGYVTFPGINLFVPTSDLSKHLNCSENDIQEDFPRFFLMPEPEDSVVSKLDEEACKFPDMKNSMLPKKIEMSTENAVVSPSINLVSFLFEQSACEAKAWKSMTAKRPNVDTKMEISNDLFISSFHQNSQKTNKRLSWTSTNVVDVQCIALKKRPRMFQCMSNNQPAPMDEGPDAVQHHETVKSPFHITAEETSEKMICRAISLQVVRMGTSWVEHRVFGLSMQVYGKVHSYVVDMLGKSVMVEDVEKNKLDLLKEGQWKRFYIECKVAALFQLEYENLGKLAVYLSNRMLGFMLDLMDLVHLPLYNSGFYYLLVVSFKNHAFEILHPNRKVLLIQNEAKVAVKNFKMAFNLAYKNSLINIDAMNTVFKSVCSSERDGDSGVFVMKMICDYNTSITFCFEPEHAKPIREMLTYYMVAHPFNEVMPTETRKILDRHGIPHDYKTPGYFPWMHEQSEANNQDSLEKIVKF